MARPVWVDNSAPATTAANFNAMTAADATEAATNAALGGSATIDDNMNRIRAAISQIVAGNFTTGMVTLLTSAVQMLPLSQKGAASGVPSLNGSSLVVQDPASKGTASGVARLDGSANLIVEAGHKIVVPGQTGATSGTSVANQGAGVFSIPSGVVSGSGVTVPNTLVTASSIIILTIVGSPNTITEVSHFRANDVAGTSFAIETICSSATTGAVDCAYLIVN